MIVNKSAPLNFHILATIKAGICLTGTQVKACRSGEVSLNGVFARVVGQEVYLEGLYGRHSKLLMTRKEIDRLIGRLKGSNLTIVPLRLYFEKCWVKVDLGICRGKKNYDKRAAIKARDINRSAFLDMPENKRL